MSIKRKLKPCGICGDPKYLWVSQPPMCRECNDMLKAIKVSVIEDMKPIKANKPKRIRIAACSKTRYSELAKYRRVRDRYFKDHPVCEYIGCNSQDVTLHHMRGRLGSLLTDKRYFKSLCLPHHQFVELHPDQAKQMGLSQSRLDKHK